MILGCVVANGQPRFVADSQPLVVGELLFQTPRTVTFEFQNKGTEKLLIRDVHPSCGCISVTFPEDSIKAGGSGTITATYDAGMMGTFYRELAVYTNERKKPFYLAFKGRVVESPLDYDGDFPIDLGNVRLNSNYVEFEDVNRGDHPVVELQVVNMEHGVYKSQLMHLPSFLTAEYLPTEIQGGRVGRIRLTLDSEKLFMDGLNQTSIYLARRMGDKVSEKNEILVSAVLLPAFRDMNATDLEKAPHIVLMDGEEMIEDDVVTVDMEDKNKVTKVITLMNTGDEELKVTAVQVFNRALTVSLGDRNIAPHTATKLKITVDARELRRAKNGPRLLIISNDPRHAKTEINVEVSTSKP